MFRIGGSGAGTEFLAFFPFIHFEWPHEKNPPCQKKTFAPKTMCDGLEYTGQSLSHVFASYLLSMFPKLTVVAKTSIILATSPAVSGYYSNVLMRGTHILTQTVCAMIALGQSSPGHAMACQKQELDLAQTWASCGLFGPVFMDCPSAILPHCMSTG